MNNGFVRNGRHNHNTQHITISLRQTTGMSDLKISKH